MKPPNVENKVRKGDIVVLTVRRSATYAFGSGRGTEVSTVFVLAQVNSASRAGVAQSLMKRSGALLYLRRHDYSLTDVHTLNSRQEQALALFKRIAWDEDAFETPAALSAALEAC